MTNTIPDGDQAPDLSASELADSVTGFDEIAIRKHFGSTFATLGDPKGGDPFQFLRALVFVHRRRQGDSDTAAFSAAQNMTTAAVTSYFPDDSEESGKDSSVSEETPSS